MVTIFISQKRNVQYKRTILNQNPQKTGRKQNKTKANYKKK